MGKVGRKFKYAGSLGAATRMGSLVGWPGGVLREAVALAMGLCLAGCCGARHFTAASLPPDLRATGLSSGQKVYLAQLAQSASPGTQIAPGDVLEVSVTGSLQPSDAVSFSVRVGEDGLAMLPQIGPVPLAGLDPAAAEARIAAASVDRQLYLHPVVRVSIREPWRNRVTVVGAVANPGVHELPRGSSRLLEALVAAGGLSEDAGTRIEVFVPGEPMGPGRAPGAVEPAGFAEGVSAGTVRLCVDLAEQAARPEGNPYLPDGSVVRVERLEPDPVYVMGLVHKPGEFAYPVRHELRLLGAIALAGGPSSKLADRIIVLRRALDGRGTVTIHASLQSAKKNPEENLVLAPGDVVSIERTPATVLLDTLEVIRFGVGATLPLF